MQPKTAEPVGVKLLRMKPPLRKERHSRNQNQSPSRLLRVLRAFAVKVQPRIHREAAKSAKSAKISRRKILSCQQRIFGLLVQMNRDLHLRSSVVSLLLFSHSVNSRVQLEVRVSFWRGMRANDGQMTSRYRVRRLVAAFPSDAGAIAAASRPHSKRAVIVHLHLTKAEPEATRTSKCTLNSLCSCELSRCILTAALFQTAALNRLNCY